MAKVIIFSGPTAGNLYNFVYLNESKDLAGRRVGGERWKEEQVMGEKESIGVGKPGELVNMNSFSLIVYL